MIIKCRPSRIVPDDFIVANTEPSFKYAFVRRKEVSWKYPKK